MENIPPSIDARESPSPPRCAYLGPAGTYTEEAAVAYSTDSTLIPYTTIQKLAQAVRNGEVDWAITPIENSLQGSVTDTLDVLIHTDGTHIFDELVLPIVHHLMAKPGTTIGEAETIYSHPQALGQCQEYLTEQLPRADQRASLSTSAGVEEMLNDPRPAVAIAPGRAADIYGAAILAKGIQDNPNNATRFLVLAQYDHAPTGKDKTSICFSFSDDRPGLLYKVMKEMADKNINLSKVESRPTREGLGQYFFLIDLEGHKENSSVRDVLVTVKSLSSMFKIFGSYPQFSAY